MIVATASPAKFPEALTESGVDPVVTQEIRDLLQRETKAGMMNKGDDWLAMLKTTVEDITKRAARA